MVKAFGIVFLILNVLLLAYFGVVYFFGIVGLFKTKKFPKSSNKCKYAVLIPARNEEKVIKELINSIRLANYDQKKIDIFVIVNNSNDNTYKICKAIKNIHVYQYNDENKRTKGYALDYLIKQIIKDYGIDSYDGFFSFDADNLVSKEYFNKMNDAFNYYDKKYTIVGTRVGKNFCQNMLTCAYSMFFLADNYYFFRGRTAFGVSIKNGGTGYLMPSFKLRNGFPWVSVTEDWEMSVDDIFKTEEGAYCDGAVFYDEQPTSLKIMWKQRLRWIFGHLQLYKKQCIPLTKRIFKKDVHNKFDTYDLLVTITPISLISFFLQLSQSIIYLFVPLFDKSITYNFLFINYNSSFNFFQNLFTSNGLLFVFFKSYIIVYIFLFIIGIILFILSDNIKYKRNPFVIIGAIFFWPIFVLLEIPISIHAFIKSSLKWNPTPHKENTSINTISN